MIAPWDLAGDYPGGRSGFRFGDGAESFVGGAGRLRAGETVAPSDFCLYNMGLYELGIDPVDVLPPMQPA